MEQIKQFFQGKFSKRTLVRYFLPVTIATMVGCLALARLFFPYIEDYPYSWTTSMVSRLGWPHVNTIGWIFFSIAWTTLGIFYLALAPYMYKRFSVLHLRLAKIMRFFMYFTAIGGLGIGLIPNYEESIICGLFHALNAGLMSIGIFITALITTIIMVEDNWLKGRNGSSFPWKLVLIYVGIVVYIFIISYFMGSGPKGSSDRYYVYIPGTPLHLTRPFWEWQLLVASIGLITLLCLIVPDIITSSPSPTEESLK